MKNAYLIFFIILLISPACKEKKPDYNPEQLSISSAKVGEVYLEQSQTVSNIPTDKDILIEFSGTIDTSTIKANIFLKAESNDILVSNAKYNEAYRTIALTTDQQFENNSIYKLDILSGLKGKNNESFTEVSYTFKTEAGLLTIDQIILNSLDFANSTTLQDIDFKDISIEILFSEPLNPDDYKSFFSLSNNAVLSFELADSDKKVILKNSEDLNDLSEYIFSISENIKSINDADFDGFSNTFYTDLDSTYKFPIISDNELLDLVQSQTFKYFWDFAHPASGMIRERNTSGDRVTTGGTGFGIMSIIVGIERNFIPKIRMS